MSEIVEREENTSENSIGENIINNTSFKSIKDYIDSKGLQNFEDIKSHLENSKIGLTVKDEGNLYIIAYYDGKSNFDEPIVHKCRGVILEKETNKVVCYTFDRSIDFINDLTYLNTKFPFTEDVVVQESIDGTQIKLFHYDGKWRRATTRSIDASKTRFSSRKTFDEMFEEALNNTDLNLDTLDKTKCYAFVLCHPDNRIITRYDKPEIVHVLTRDLNTMKIDLAYDIGVRKPESYTFDSYEKLLEETANLGYEKEGFILHSSDGCMMKIKGKKYLSSVKMRGNTNNILFHYLELRYKDNQSNEETSKNIEGFLKHFNEYREIFKLFEENLRSLAKYIHVEYICRFVTKKIDSQKLTWYYRPIIYTLHTNYYNTKEVTSYDTVVNFLNNLHPAQLCFIYNNTFSKKSKDIKHNKETKNKIHLTNKNKNNKNNKNKHKSNFKKNQNKKDNNTVSESN